jgi:uncharacterized protein
MEQDQIFKDLKNEIDKIKLIDSHCHIVPINELIDSMDLFKLYIMHNCFSFMSSGMSEESHAKLADYNVGLADKWEIFKPYWLKTSNTGFAKIFLKAMKVLYGVSEITDANYQDLSNNITHSYSSKSEINWYAYVYKEKAGIEKGILDYGTTVVDKIFFFATYRFENRRVPACDHFITIRTREELDKIENYYGRNIVCFDDFLDVFEEAFERRVNEGIVTVKTLLGYRRTLDFANVTKDEAEKVFNTVFARLPPTPGSLGHHYEGPSWEDNKILQDFLFHRMLLFASKHNIAIQIHGGFQSGYRQVFYHADPKLLLNLFLRYPNVNFVVLHTATPFQYDLGCLVKNFSNVRMDFSWSNSLSPSISSRVMSDMLEFLPAHKIFGFGSDNSIIEGALGESIFARNSLAQIMSTKIRSGYFIEDEAVDICKKIFRENIIDYFHLNLK